MPANTFVGFSTIYVRWSCNRIAGWLGAAVLVAEARVSLRFDTASKEGALIVGSRREPVPSVSKVTNWISGTLYQSLTALAVIKR